MKKLLFVMALIVTVKGIAQFGNPAPSTPKKTYRTYAPKKIFEDTSDSAYIYYNKGWEAYKANDMGAARWFWERGANCNSDAPARYSSAFRLGLMHQNGEGVGVNYEIAFYYYTLAHAYGKRQGNVDATKNIAAYYENGIVVTQDFRKALEWYQKAKAQGNKYCDADIKRLKQKIAQFN